MLMALMGNVALPAGELARVSHVTPQTASAHLGKLVDGRLLAVEQQGRHRYYRLANSDVAHAIEALLALDPGSGHPTQQRAADDDRGPKPLRNGDVGYARTCYSHLAGHVAVELADAFVRRKMLVESGPRNYLLTDTGVRWCSELGIEFDGGCMRHPRFALRCLDWTERRHHIAGHFGTALLDRFRAMKWLVSLRGSRAVRLTHQGEAKLSALFEQ
jgi:hypothetical protein